MPDKSQMAAAAASPLFRGVGREDMEQFLEEIRAYPVQVLKNDILIEQGERRSSIHIVLTGSAVGEKLSADGRRTIINEFAHGSIFGDMLSGGEEKSPVAVRMVSDGAVLKIPFSSLLSQSTGCAATREAVLRNLFREISQKYFALSRRVDMLLCPTLRGKIALYLLAQAKTAGESFASPHTREQQAELLCCDRSALSRELSRLKQEGVIEFSGRKFHILDFERLNAFGIGG